MCICCKRTRDFYIYIHTYRQWSTNAMHGGLSTIYTHTHIHTGIPWHANTDWLRHRMEAFRRILHIHAHTYIHISIHWSTEASHEDLFTNPTCVHTCRHWSTEEAVQQISNVRPRKRGLLGEPLCPEKQSQRSVWDVCQQLGRHSMQQTTTLLDHVNSFYF